MHKKVVGEKKVLVGDIDPHIGTFMAAPTVLIETVQRTNRDLNVKGTFFPVTCKGNATVKRWHQY